MQDLLAANMRYIRNAESQARAKREEWASWNPQRAAAKELAAAVARGELALDECELLRLQNNVRRTPSPGHPRVLQRVEKSTPLATADESGTHGYDGLHSKPFRWPAPKSPEVCAAVFRDQFSLSHSKHACSNPDCPKSVSARPSPSPGHPRVPQSKNERTTILAAAKDSGAHGYDGLHSKPFLWPATKATRGVL
jgi:hypothetical protein